MNANGFNPGIIDSNYTIHLDPGDIESSFHVQQPQNMSITFHGMDGSTIGILKFVDGKLNFSGDANDCASVFFNAMRVAWLDRVWLPMDTAPHDTEIVVWCDGVQDLPPMVSLCKWHPDAGFYVDELREPKWWTNKPTSM